MRFCGLVCAERRVLDDFAAPSECSLLVNATRAAMVGLFHQVAREPGGAYSCLLPAYS